MSERNIATLADKDLTPEELAKRVKNRDKRAAQKKKKSESIKDDKKPQVKNQLNKKTPQIRERLTREEQDAKQLQIKEDRLANNTKDSVVVIAATTEAKAIAYKVGDVNTIIEYTRNNMGTQKVSFDQGQEVISQFNENVLGSLDKFINIAASYGIGSRRTLDEYKKAQNKINSDKQKETKFIQRCKDAEIDTETKLRELDEKSVLKATAELDKALEAVTKAEKGLLDAKATQARNFEEKVSAQDERFLLKKEVEKKQREVDKEKKKEEKAAKEVESKQAESSAVVQEVKK